MIRRLIMMLCLTLSSPVSIAAEPEQIGPAWVYSTEADFEDAKADLIMAIEDRGMVVSYISHAQTMLARTADAVGDGTQVYGDAEIVLFCKSDLSHRLVGANPHDIVLCPYAIAIYTLAGQPQRVYLSFRKPFDREPAYQPVVRLLQDIIHDVVGE